MHLTIAYITNRLEPHFHWFCESLKRETLACGVPMPPVVMIDFHAEKKGRAAKIQSLAERYGIKVTLSAPKPTPWQGKHRLTDHDAFAAGNARNSALCLTRDGYLAFVDDVSFLLNGWLRAVMDGMRQNRVICGAYRKVKEMKTDGCGNLTHWLPLDGRKGLDNRWAEGRKEPVQCAANWLYGCSFAIPTEIMLNVNGFDECLDGLSFEDVCFGMRLGKAGQAIWYDQRMMTFESEEAHNNPADVSFRRHNRSIAKTPDCPWWNAPEGRDDGAWNMLAWINEPSHGFRSRGTPDLRAVRSEMLNGKIGFPLHSGFFVWPDGKNLLGQ